MKHISSVAQSQVQQSGVLSWFVHNKVAANILMLVVLIGGMLALIRMRQEVFPEIDTGIITVLVPYPGASPEEVEAGVVVRVEEAIEGIEGIKRIRSVAAESQGTVIAELEDFVDKRTALSDIEGAVNRIQTFPQEIERPVVSQSSIRIQVLNIVLSGEVPEETLKELAGGIRDELTAMSSISQVGIAGTRRYEISVEVSEEALRRYGLTFEQVAAVVRRSSLDLPSGSIETKGGEILLRTKGQRYRGRQFEDLALLTRNDGTVLRLGAVAEVIDGFEESEIKTFFDGEPSALLTVHRVGDQDAIEVASIVKQYVREKRDQLPSGVSIDIWSDQSIFLKERINLLVRNAYIGLALVFLCLMLFMDPYLSFWTTMGIPISFMGAFAILSLIGVTINMISLFAFIVVLGIVVDDAIIVGENIFAYRQQGMDPRRAAVKGIREMAAPVITAILTSVVAFTPLLFTAGQIGAIIAYIPLVVIVVLMLSLVEALFILPAHLSGRHRIRRSGPFVNLGAIVQSGLDRFIRGPYMAIIQWSVRWRYATITIAISIFIVTLGFVIGGHIKFVFFESVESDNVLAELTMPQGTPVEKTRAVVQKLEQAAMRVRNKLEVDREPDKPRLFKHMNTTIGEQPFKRRTSGGPGSQGISTSMGDSHLAEVNIELLSSEYRDIPSSRVEQLWRKEVGEIIGVSSLVFQSSFFSAGEAIHIDLSHPDFATTLRLVEQLKETLRRYRGVTEIDDSFVVGKQEIGLSLKDEGRMLGLSLEDLARQVRHAFYGVEAQRIQRGRDDVKVMVRYPKEERRSVLDIETMRLRTPGGIEIPFGTVAEVKRGRGYAQIDRADRRRIVSITADVDETLPGVSADSINTELASSVLPKLQQDNPGLIFKFGGERAEQQESMESLKFNSLVALLGIFALLGVQFRSYVQPLIVMSVIPFGLIGAIAGHIVMGLNLSFLSLFGVVALTGVVVNDSLIMIDLINRQNRKGGQTLYDVVVQSGARRFRPILLTTLTTFLGLTPILLERSLQAKFLIPMAVSLAFGVLFATAITLILVPTLYMILEDVRALRIWPSRLEPAKRSV